MTMTHVEAKLRLKELGEKLTAYSFEHSQHVLVIHQDGSRMDFSYAFAKIEANYLFVFTEHNGYHHFCLDDLDFWTAYSTAI